MAISDMLGKLGGIGNILDMIKNPAQLPGLIAGTFPNATHTIGRKHILMEIAGRASLLAFNCENLIARALVEQRDLNAEEFAALDKMEYDLLMVAIKLKNYPKTGAEVSVDTLKEVYAIPGSHGGAIPPKGNGQDAQAGA